MTVIIWYNLPHRQNSKIHLAMFTTSTSGMEVGGGEASTVPLFVCTEARLERMINDTNAIHFATTVAYPGVFLLLALLISLAGKRMP